MLYSKIAVSILVGCLATLSKACDIIGVSECNHFNTIREFHFNAFIPEHKWEQHCRNTKIALDCAFQDKYVKGCSNAELFLYKMNKDIYEQVCMDGEYLKHTCLGSEELNSIVHEECFTPLEDVAEVTCEVLESTRTCASSKIMQKCGVEDSKYMDRLAYYFLRSYDTSEYDASCKLAKPQYTVTPMKTTAAINDLSTTAADGSRGVTDEEEDGKTSHQHGHNHDKNSQNRLIPTSILLCLETVFVIMVLQ